MSEKAARLMMTDSQRGALWPMLAEAWLAHALESGERVNDSKAKELWRKRYLGARLGVWSLKQIPRGGRMYARVMGALQEIARNGIDWIIKAEECDAATLVFHARAVLAVWDIPEGYACGIARNACSLPAVPEHLGRLEPAQLGDLIRILHAQAPRIHAAAHRPAAAAKTTNGDEPEAF